MKIHAIKLIRSWRILLLLATLPVLTNCSRIESSVELHNSEGEPYSFEGARVDVFDLNPTAALGQSRVLKGLGTAASDGVLAVDVITALVDDEALYGVEVRCPEGNTVDTCNVESPLHVVLSGTQLKSGGWNTTALTEAAFQNIVYYASVEYSVAEIRQMLDTYSAALLVADPAGLIKNYDNLLAWRLGLTNSVRRPHLLADASESLAAGISSSDIKMLARQWVSPTVARLAIPPVWEVREIRIDGNYAYFMGNGTFIIDVSDPERPVVVEQAPDSPAATQDNMFYGMTEIPVQFYDVLRVSEFFVADLDLATPSAVLSAQVGDPIGDFGAGAMSGRYAYAYAWANYGTLVQTIDLINPLAPALVSMLELHHYRPIGVRDNHVILHDDIFNGLAVMDATNPAAPAVLSSHISFNDSTEFWGIRESKQYGDHIFIPWTIHGELIDPLEPEAGIHQQGCANLNSEASAEDFVGGLFALDISTPTAPATASHICTPEGAHAVALSGTHAYVALSNKKLQIIDYSDPTQPSMAGLVNLPALAIFLAANDNQLWVTTGDRKIEIYDISNPVNPVPVASFDTPELASHVTFDDGYAYVANGSAGLLIFDISRTATPTLVATTSTRRNVGSTLFVGDYIYANVSTGISAGFEILKKMPATTE